MTACAALRRRGDLCGDEARYVIRGRCEAGHGGRKPACVEHAALLRSGRMTCNTCSTNFGWKTTVELMEISTMPTSGAA